MNTFSLECGLETVTLHVDAEAAIAISNKFGGQARNPDETAAG